MTEAERRDRILELAELMESPLCTVEKKAELMKEYDALCLQHRRQNIEDLGMRPLYEELRREREAEKAPAKVETIQEPVPDPVPEPEVKPPEPPKPKRPAWLDDDDD